MQGFFCAGDEPARSESGMRGGPSELKKKKKCILFNVNASE